MLSRRIVTTLVRPAISAAAARSKCASWRSSSGSAVNLSENAGACSLIWRFIPDSRLWRTCSSSKELR